MGRFTQYGFERDPLQVIVANERQKWKTRLGANGVDIDREDSLLNILATITAESKFQADQVMEEAVANLTIAGAEGVYLDNILGKVTPRLGPQASTATALVQFSRHTPLSQQLSTSNLINTTDGKKLYPTRTVLLRNEMRAAYLSRSIVTLSFPTPVTFYLTINGATYSTVINSTSLGDFDDVFYPAFRSWLINTVGLDGNLIKLASNNTAIYIGYDNTAGWTNPESGAASTGRPVGFGSTFAFSCVPSSAGSGEFIGGVAEVPVRNEKAGYAPIGVNTISSMTPTFTGYERAFNIEAGSYAGSDTESDAAYYLRYQRVTNDPTTVTREGMERGLLESGLSKVGISDGIEPYTGFVYVAGSPTDGRSIAQVIYDVKPIGYVTYGSSSETIYPAYSGGIGEVIRWSIASSVSIDVNVTYQVSGVALSAAEQQTIRSIVNDTISALQFGATFLTSQLDAAIIRSFPSNRLIGVQCSVKRTDLPTFQTGTIALVAANQYYNIPDTITNIIFTQV